MSELQEIKELLQQVRDSSIRTEEQFKQVNERHFNLKDSVIELAKEQIEMQKQTSADRNMVKGVLWLGGTGFFATVIGFIASYFKHN